MDVVALPVRSRGLTLVELLITLAIGMVLLGIGIPSWSSFTQSNAMVAARNQMTRALSQARADAVTHRQFVTVCPSLDQSTCHRDYTLWHEGFISFIDRNGNRQRDADDRLLQVMQPMGNGILIYSSTGRRSVRYNHYGATNSNVTLRFCTEGRGKSIIVNVAGRARLFDTEPGGDPVTCTS